MRRPRDGMAVVMMLRFIITLLRLGCGLATVWSFVTYWAHIVALMFAPIHDQYVSGIRTQRMDILTCPVRRTIRNIHVVHLDPGCHTYTGYCQRPQLSRVRDCVAYTNRVANMAMIRSRFNPLIWTLWRTTHGRKTSAASESIFILQM